MTMQANIPKEKTSVTESKWSAVWAMSLCAMVLVASEFLPVSLLTPIASGLNMTEGQAGQSIAISGLFALVTSLSLTSVIGKIDRRSILLFFTGLMGISGIIVSFAPTPLILMAGRALLGICIGGFWSMSAATIMRLIPEKSVPKALAILNGGNALSTTIAAPLGSFLGSIIGWRGAFFCIVPLAVIAFAWQWFKVPHLPAQHRDDKKVNVGTVLKLLLETRVALGMLSVMLLFMGQFALFTYLRPFLETVTGVTAETLSLVLLAMGVFGLIGTLLIERFIAKHLYTILIVIPFLMTLTGAALIVFGHSLVITTILICFWGFLGTSAPVGWWTWLSKTLPHEAEAGGGLMVALVQLAITLGAAIGGLMFDAYGYKSTFALSAVLLLLGSIMAFVTKYVENKLIQRI